MIHVLEINDADELANNRLLWESLWRRTRDASYFQSFDWFDSYRRHFGRSQQLKVLVATLAAKPIGILPLVVRKSETGVGGVRVLGYPKCQWGHCSGPIGPNSAATLIATMKYLRNCRRDWDLCDLQSVDVNRRDRGRTRNALRTAGMRFMAKPDSGTPIVDIESNWMNYWSSRPVALRRHYHQAERQLKSEGTLEYVRFRPERRAYSDAACRWELYDELLKSIHSDASNATIGRAFLRELHSRAVGSAAVDLNLLRLNNRAIAVTYGYVENGGVDVIHIHGHSEFADAACRVLVGRMLQDGAKKGDVSYRFAPSIGQFGKDYQTSQIVTERLTHFAPSAPKAQLLRWNHSLQTWLGRLNRVSAALNL